MHLLTGEVAPLAPLLIPIGEIVVWVVALAFCLLCVYIAKALFGTASSAVGWIPLFGKVVSRSLTSIEQKIVSFMSGAAETADARMGAAFHQLARVIDWLGAEIARHANLIWTLSQLLLGQQVANLAHGLVDLTLHEIKSIGGQIDHLLRRVHAIEATVERGIGRDVLPRLHDLEREYEHVIGKVIPDIRAGERELEHGAIHTWKWIRAHPSSLASTAFAGAVAWALARLGGSWIRCSRWNRIGKQVCGPGGSEFEAFLGLLIAGLAIEDFRTLVKLMQGIEHTAAETVATILRV